MPVTSVAGFFTPMKDLVYNAFCKIADKKTKVNKIYLLTRYLRVHFKVTIDRKSMVRRIRDYKSNITKP